MTGPLTSISATARKPSNFTDMERRKKKNKKRIIYQHAGSSSNSGSPDTGSVLLSKSLEEHILISTAKQCIAAGITPERAGVILYTVHQKQLYIGMAVDSASHDLTDFGGRIYYDADLNCITGSLREFHEETLGIFDPISPDLVDDYTTVYDNNNLIMFLHININPNTVSEKFLTIHNKHVTLMGDSAHRNLEVCGITWLTISTFIAAVGKYGTIYERVRKVLQHVKDWRQVF
jgi:hypothetical protein